MNFSMGGVSKNNLMGYEEYYNQDVDEIEETKVGT